MAGFSDVISPQASCEMVTKVKDIENLALNPVPPASAVIRLTTETRETKKLWKRNEPIGGPQRFKDFSDLKPTTLSDRAAVLEAARCLKCADAPCSKGCPTSIDVKAFIQCIASRNFYGAARLILSNNAVGLSCGMVCPVSELCVGNCNLALTEEGAININGLQHFAVQRFMEMRVPQILNPKTPCLGDPDKRIALVGAGPASISCSNFLGRLGYKHVTVFEKHAVAGGLSTLEIPQYRLPYRAVRFEQRLCEDLGVKFEFGRALGREFSLEDLRRPPHNYDAVFLGIGLYKSKTSSAFKGLTTSNGVWTSKDFLRAVAISSKPLGSGCACAAQTSCRSAEQGCSGSAHELPEVGPHAVVLGAGDTAFDCATAAYRCGAKRVTIIFRKTWSDMRGVPEERDLAIKELCDFLPNCRPEKVLLDPSTNRISALELVRTEKDDVGKYQEYQDATFRLRCSCVITAFGCSIDPEVSDALKPLVIDAQTGLIKVALSESTDLLPLQSLDVPWVFCGGDVAGGGMTVEAANDGKVAAWSIHCYLQQLDRSNRVEPQLPLFHSPIDDVDISVDMCGMHFVNPFGLASAPCSTSGSMIRRAFEAGWGFAVTKTFTLDKHLVTNVSPRIVRGTLNTRVGPSQGSFLNIELISEKTAAYWVQVVKELKRDFPDRIVVASIMVPYVKEEWEELTRITLESGADALELNLSCPHGMAEVGMGLACGQDEKLVRDITKWVVDIAGNVPVFPKLTPNVTEIAVMAKAAEEGGAAGVTVINTVSGIMDVDGRNNAWPRIGDQKYTTRGGISGDANRPLGLRAVSMIRKWCPNLRIMGTGGASSAETSAQYIRMGASVVQICSSIQNQDYTVIDDYISGLKAHLYMLGRSDLKEWDVQTPPQPQVAPGIGESLPKFGKFRHQRVEMQKAEIRRAATVVEALPEMERALEIVSVPEEPVVPVKLDSLIGIVADRYVRSHNDLSRHEQVIASVDESLCINCGKCYMTCNDNAYQAILFDKDTHQVKIIADNCTGCGLCLAVCPVPNCISFVPRPNDSPHRVKRWA